MIQSSESNEGNKRVIRAVDHLDPDESVVRSGILLAEAVLAALEQHGPVSVLLDGIKGASSSYFNVFLRRLEEGCGLAEIGRGIQLEYGSSIQERVFERSFEAIRKGPRRPTTANTENNKGEPLDPPRRPLWRRLFRL